MEKNVSGFISASSNTGGTFMWELPTQLEQNLIQLSPQVSNSIKDDIRDTIEMFLHIMLGGLYSLDSAKKQSELKAVLGEYATKSLKELKQL